MSDTITIQIEPDGQMIFIYEDKKRFFLDLGETVIKRASHIEPTATAQWTADLSPIGGPILGPFDTHREALVAEVDYITNQMQTAPSNLFSMN